MHSGRALDVLDPSVEPWPDGAYIDVFVWSNMMGFAESQNLLVRLDTG
jgi:hypothetical protein